MTRRAARIAAAAILIGAGPAAAHPPQGYLDGYFVPSADLERSPSLGSDQGSGFGVKGMAPASDGLVLTGEYQAVDYDGAGEFTQMRAGAGLIGPGGGGLMLEYIRLDDFIEADGFGIHLRLGADNAYGQVGYVAVDDDFEESNGLEFAGGFVAELGPSLGAFFDVRYTELEGQDSNARIEATDVRIGLRLMFQR